MLVYILYILNVFVITIDVVVVLLLFVKVARDMTVAVAMAVTRIHIEIYVIKFVDYVQCIENVYVILVLNLCRVCIQCTCGVCPSEF